MLASPSAELPCDACHYSSIACYAELCFPTLGARAPQNVLHVFLVGCSKSQKVRIGTPMLGGAHFLFVLLVLGGVAKSHFFNSSAARMLILGWRAAVLCLPVIQLQLLCGALFSNTWSAMPTWSASMGTSWNT